MTKIVDKTLIIEPEAPRRCSECGRDDECRPYGEGGADVCYPCATGTPERQERTKRRIQARFEGVDTVVAGRRGRA